MQQGLGGRTVHRWGPGADLWPLSHVSDKAQDQRAINQRTAGTTAKPELSRKSLLCWPHSQTRCNPSLGRGRVLSRRKKLRHGGHAAGGRRGGTRGQDAGSTDCSPNQPQDPHPGGPALHAGRVPMSQPLVEAPDSPRAGTFGEKLCSLHLTGVLRPNCSRTAQTWSRWRATAAPR